MQWGLPAQSTARPVLADRSQTRGPGRQLAAALLDSKPCLLFFGSPSCGLCRSLKSHVRKVQASEPELEVVHINTDDSQQWTFELLEYDIKEIPCFVLLDVQGRATLRTSAPRSQQQMIASLDSVLQIGRGGASGTWFEHIAYPFTARTRGDAGYVQKTERQGDRHLPVHGGHWDGSVACLIAGSSIKCVLSLWCGSTSVSLMS